MPRNPNKAHCTFPGCHNWAMRGQQRCYVHRYPPTSNRLHGQAWTVRRASPEQDTPPAEGGPPPPSAGSAPNQPAPPIDPDPCATEPLGAPFQPGACPDTPSSAGEDPQPAPWADDPEPSMLDLHITALEERLRRLDIHVRRLDAQLEHDPALLPAYTRLLNLQGQLTSRLARLLRERQLIGQTDDHILMDEIMDQALDEAGKRLGVQL